jgi:hypothetical protein
MLVRLWLVSCLAAARESLPRTAAASVLRRSALCSLFAASVVVAIISMTPPAHASTWYYGGLYAHPCVMAPGQMSPYPYDPTGTFICLDVQTVAAGLRRLRWP